MGHLMIGIAFFLFIGWAIGVFGIIAIGLIHILLVIGLIFLVLRVIQGRKIL